LHNAQGVTNVPAHPRSPTQSAKPAAKPLNVRMLGMATPAGFEPATCRLEGGCSIQLSYGVKAVERMGGYTTFRSGGPWARLAVEKSEEVGVSAVAKTILRALADSSVLRHEPERVGLLRHQCINERGGFTLWRRCGQTSATIA
jgi:hypothetical protein